MKNTIDKNIVRFIRLFWSVNLVFVLIISDSFAQGDLTNVSVPISKDGIITSWLVAGPFEQPTFGFGNPADADKIGEKTIEPYGGKIEHHAMTASGNVKWETVNVDNKSFLDFNNSIGWYLPGKRVEKIWLAKAGYASTYISSPKKQKAKLLLGSNSSVIVFLNHQKIYSLNRNRNAIPDLDTISINLSKGRNILLIKVGNSNSNLTFGFFGELKWQWGFYARLLSENNSPLTNCSVVIPTKNTRDNFNVVSTFYFKKLEGKLKQRIDINIFSNSSHTEKGKITFKLNGKLFTFQLDNILFGNSRHQIYLPQINENTNAVCNLKIGDKTINKKVKLFHQRHYKLHLVLLAHTDIGYTNPQPIVKEIHVNNIDSVLTLCDTYPDFKWTLETLWQLRQYEQSRPKKIFMKVIDYIKTGRISVSPIYSNPFTGRISEEEMIQSLALAEKYKKEYGIKFNAAVYDDVPGESWFLPEVLKKSGVKFLANGINEVYNNYKLQKNLPKAFNWVGPDGSRVLAYRDEAYNEGRSYGLEKGNKAIEDRLWNRINKLKAWGYPYDMILLISAYMDNNGIATDQYHAAKKWNKEYAYPKFVISNLSEFADEFVKKYENKVPNLKGDMTSPWDITSQGEFVRNKKTRWVQHQLLSTEKLSAINWMLDQKQTPFTNEVFHTYQSLLEFDGHGSGLEYGYGSPEANKITMDFRGQDVNDAYFNTKELLERSIYRKTKPEESLVAEGVYVFNSLSWKRTSPIRIEFPANQTQQYEVIDLVNNKVVPSYRKGYKLYFIADSLPEMGFRKYKLSPIAKPAQAVDNDLRLSNNSIENKYYKISFNKVDGKITSIVDKKNEKELLNSDSELPFNVPLVEIFQNHKTFEPFLKKNAEIKIIDERPVRIILEVDLKDILFEKEKYILWSNIDRVDTHCLINLEALKSPKKYEEFGLAFPFNIKNHSNRVELLGGFANPQKDILPGVDTSAFSIRRSVAQFNNENSVSWTCVDNRVIRLRKIKGDNKGVLISNVVNDFPKNWNRNEVNKGKLLLRFSFTEQPGSFNPSFTSRFGWDLNTQPVVRKSWYRSKPQQGSYINISNQNILLLNMISVPEENSVLLRLQNVNNQKNESANISSTLFRKHKILLSDFFGNNTKEVNLKNDSFKISLNPNEVSTIKIVLKKK